VVVIAKGVPDTEMDSVASALWAIGVVESVTCTVKLKLS
jgi:hypothetical protein